ncbi:MAG: alpha/beta fold hydrolase [Rhizobacter sp.]|nr:alpha/beta fold hydrolase [Rhizobacter sp.]
MRLTATLLFIAAIGYAGLCVALYLFQRSLIYFPQPAAARTPVMQLSRGEVTVLASVREHAGPDAVIYFGGNAEDVSQSLAPLAEAYPQHAVYLLHYRGYGGSGGSPSEAALTQDALALFDQVHQTHPRVTVIGRSLGSGVAVQLASQRPVAQLVLVTPYDSLQALAAAQFPAFPVRWMLKDRFDSGLHAAQVRAPALLIAADQDEVIPLVSTRQLFARFAKGQAVLHVLPRTSHNTISVHPLYWQLLRDAR